MKWEWGADVLSLSCICLLLRSGEMDLPPRTTPREERQRCGLGHFSPGWLQLLASKKAYVVMYGLLGMNQTAISSYLVGTISTIERRFGLPSSTTGVIASSWDIGAVVTALLWGYLGGSPHRTRCLSVCSILAALSCYFRLLPHLLYESGPDHPQSSFSSSSNKSSGLCWGEMRGEEPCSLNVDGLVTFLVLAVAHLALGIGTSTYNTLGMAYLDDNSLKNKLPLLLGIVSSLRYIGPTFGFLIASYALKNSSRSGKESDKKWVGAWHIGWIPLGTVHLVLALGMALFPRELPREAARRTRQEMIGSDRNTPPRSSNDFKSTVRRLLANRLFVFNSLSLTCYLFGVVGYTIFMPKYIETQFGQTASTANFITGMIGLLCNALGMMCSGVLISRYKPHARALVGWNLVTLMAELGLFLMFASLGCNGSHFSSTFVSNTSPKQKPRFSQQSTSKNMMRSISRMRSNHGLCGYYLHKIGRMDSPCCSLCTVHDTMEHMVMECSKLNLVSECNRMCNCSLNYSPICSKNDKFSFYSPCFAGCTHMELINGTKFYGTCSCLPENSYAREGPCSDVCTNHLIIFIVLLSFSRFLSATSRAGNTIIQFRSVNPEDKSVAIAFTEVLTSGLAYIPAPIIYGRILDSSCLVWTEVCGTRANCRLYHGKQLRYRLNFTAAAFLFLAILLSVGVIIKVKNLKIYDEDLNEMIFEEQVTKEPLMNENEKKGLRK